MRTHLLFVLGVALMLGTSISVSAQDAFQVVNPTQDIVDKNQIAGSFFGQAVAISSDAMFIGKYGVTSPSGKTRAGMVYVYKKENADWVLTDSILSPLDEIGICFGYRLATDGKRLVVGASESFVTTRTKDGFVSVYVKNDAGKWVAEQEVIRPKEKREAALWGSAIAIDGDVMAVGSSNYKNGTIASAGTAQIFERSANGVWEQKLDNTPTEKARMGRTVAVHGNKVVLASLDLGGFVYEKENGEWVEKDRLDLISTVNYYGLSLENNTIMAGDYTNKKVIVYERNDQGKWERKQELTEPDGLNSFGINIILKGDAALITTNNMGTCFLFTKDNTGKWQQTANLNYTDTEVAGQFGFAADFNGQEALIGRHGYKQGTTTVGRAHYYDLTSVISNATTLPSMQLSGLKVGTLSDGITLSASSPLSVQIFTIDGKTAGSAVIATEPVFIPLQKGVYLIRSGQETIKVIL